MTHSQTTPLYQDRFLDFLSHDLREPARLVSQFLKLLKDRNENSMDKKSEEFLEYAISASKKMDMMIQALSGMSRIPKHHEEKMDVQMSNLVQDVYSDLEDVITSTQAEVVYQGESFIYARKEALRIIIKELVINSLIHSRPIGNLKIEISTKQIGEVTRLVVKDNGSPIPKGWREKVFEPFQKFNMDSKRLGIGLTKIRLMVEKYSGNISMEISDLEETMLICELK